VLVAGTPEAASLACAVLGDEAKVVAVYSVQDALSELVAHGPFDCVVCSLRFDEARMFEFLYSLHAGRQRVASRVVYLHASAPQLSANVRPAIETALQALGVAAFIDFPALVAELREPAARDRLREAILGAAA
jgi:CheY-like chemotaxis protein